MQLVEPYRNIRKSEKVVDAFLGFNNTESAKEREFSNTHNLSSDKFPSVVPRNPRELVTTLTAPNGVFSFKGSLYTVDGTSFKKDGVNKGTVTNGNKCIIEFNEFVLIFPDKKFYDTVGDTFGTFANGTIVTDANPDIQKATVHNNRVFGIKGNQIFASKQGDFKEWNVFDQLNTDSWATDVAGAVTFNTISAYQNHVVVQSNVNMFELYGYKPSNFQIQETVKVGSEVFSYVEVNSVLYFANREGLFAFTGGIPRKISGMIGMPFISAELGADKRNVYASVYDGTQYHLFRFDTQEGVTYREDNLQVVQFAMHNNKLHALCADGKMYKFDSGTEVINWELETSEIIDDFFLKTGMKKFEIHAEMGINSSLSVFIKGDTDHEYQHVKTFVAESNRMLLIPVILNKNCYKIKITGIGYVKINAFKRTVQRGGRM